MRNLKLKAALCVALFVSAAARGDETVIEHRGLSVECRKQGSQVQLNITSEEGRGKLRLVSLSGNRLSSTINAGSRVSFSMNQEQFPVTVIYESEGKESEFEIAQDCVSEG